MSRSVIIFINIIFVALVTGTMFGIWIGYNPKTLSESTYIEQQQNMISHLNVLMPMLGMIGIIFTALHAFLQKSNKINFYSLLFAVLLLIASGLITRFGNQSINEIVMTWSLDSSPENWEDLRNKWWSLHIIRTITAITALFIIVRAGINPENKSQHS